MKSFIQSATFLEKDCVLVIVNVLLLLWMKHICNKTTNQRHVKKTK